MLDIIKKTALKNTKYLKFFRILLFILIIFSVILISKDFLFLVYFMIFANLILWQNKEKTYYFVLASTISFIWVLVSKKMYGYAHEVLKIFGYNTYPFFGWALGLFIIYLIYEMFRKIYKVKIFWKQFILFLIIYWFFLLSAETIAYHFLSIKNLATSMYAGLPFCNCIHAPFWMQMVYLLMGPIYFLILEIIKLKLKTTRNNLKCGRRDSNT